MSAILAGIAALGTIIGGIVYLVKTGVWVFKKTPEESSQEIADAVSKREQAAKDTGVPQ